MQEHLTFPSSPLYANSPPTNQPPLNTTLPLPTASSTTPHPTPTPTKPFIPRPWLSGPAPTPATCPDLSRAVWLAARLGLETPHLTSLTHPQKATDKVGKTNSPFPAFHKPTPSILPHPVTHNAPLHAFCQRIPVVVASVAEAEYAAAFGGGQVLVELTLTLTNLGHPQQSPPLLFVDNECAIGLATSSVRPKKSKSIDMRLDWIRERAGQNFFRLVFLPGLINPADFFTKILPIYRHISALPFLHGTPHHPQPPHNFAPTIPPTTPHHHQRSSRRDAVRHRDPPTLASP